jgi:hypothetical protein
MAPHGTPSHDDSRLQRTTVRPNPRQSTSRLQNTSPQLTSRLHGRSVHGRSVHGRSVLGSSTARPKASLGSRSAHSASPLGSTSIRFIPPQYGSYHISAPVQGRPVRPSAPPHTHSTPLLGSRADHCTSPLGSITAHSVPRLHDSPPRPRSSRPSAPDQGRSDLGSNATHSSSEQYGTRLQLIPPRLGPRTGQDNTPLGSRPVHRRP